jgi:hypothetical protein
MADYGRSGDHPIRERESQGNRREFGVDRGSERTSERGGWGRGSGDHDRSSGSSRGGGMFGSSAGRGDDDWTRGRREELGWGGGDRSSGRREEHGSTRGDRDRSDRGWFGGDRDRSSDRSERGRQQDHRGDREHDDRHDQDNRHDHDERGWAASSGRSDPEDRDRDRGFGRDDSHEGLPIDETSRLIASNKVEGTAVYARDSRRLGSIYNFMVDKRSGKVEYAVMSYGGFLGMGTRYYPMPWDILSYDTRLGGYRVDMMERDLERAPSFDRDSEPSFDTSYGRRVRGWYGLGA